MRNTISIVLVVTIAALLILVLGGCPARGGSRSPRAIPHAGRAPVVLPSAPAKDVEPGTKLEREVDETVAKVDALGKQRDDLERQMTQALSAGDNDKAAQLDTQIDKVDADLEALGKRQDELATQIDKLAGPEAPAKGKAAGS